MTYYKVVAEVVVATREEAFGVSDQILPASFFKVFDPLACHVGIEAIDELPTESGAS